MVIVDTSVWIPALKSKDAPEKAEIRRLVLAREAAIVGIVLVEILRGAKDRGDFDELLDQLQAAVILDDDEESWLLASQILFDLRRSGQSIPMPDAVIAAHAILGDHSLYTSDQHFQRIPSVKLHEVS